jgi:RNA polymerase sigma factor (sigma-70 family)
MIKTISVTDASDAQLVAHSLTGNRDAFGQIVARYQTLVCSLAYSATGNLDQSEDLAQETFLAAWKQLASLREPNKLRSWLCGIARNLTFDSLKKQGREPSHVGEPLDTLDAAHAAGPQPHDFAISQEEAAILWRSIERIPEIYREPLILFYREHQSIETVAQSLELTEDAVKQRLSRGRKLLHEQVLAFVEGALERTNPGKTFTIGVLAALPVLAGSSAKAAAAVTAAAKSAGFLGVLSALAGPLLILFGNFIPYRMALAAAVSDEERRRIKTIFGTIIAASLALSGLAFGILYSIFRDKYHETVTLLDGFECWFVCFILAYLLSLACAAIWTRGARHRYLAKTLAREHNGVFPPPAWEYRSNARFLRLPLVHIRVGDRFASLRPPVKAWIAIGHQAVGGLFAFGAIAVAPFAIGGLAIGLFTLGGFVIGLASFGGLAFGLAAQGGIAIGWQSSGFCALAWNAAQGNFALARDFALGNFAHAAQVNNDLARQFVDTSLAFQFFRFENRHWLWTSILWITPLFLQWRVIARQRRMQRSAVIV